MLPLLALTVAGGVLRFATLDLQSFWYDEAVTVGIVEMSFGGMLGEIPDSESTPPLYYVLAWLWTKPFGTGEVGIRSLSALLGTAAIPAFYAAARELMGSRRVGLAVAALAAFNPLLVWYSQEARTYALMMLLGALSLYYFARLLRSYHRGALVGWALTSALALTAHYFTGFLVVPEAVWLVLRSPRRPVWLAAGTVGAAGLALLPLALHQQSLDLASFIRTTALPYRLLRSGKQFLVGFEAPLEVALAVVAIAVLVAGIALALWRPQPGVTAAAVLAGLGLLVPFVLALLGLDYLDTRNVILAWLPLVTLACAGLVRSHAGLVGVGVVCAIGLACVVGVAATPLWQRDNWRGAVDELGPAGTNRAVVVTPRETAVVPFLLYAPDAERREGKAAGFQEVALISKHGRTKHDIHPPDPPRPARPRLTGFVEARRVYAKNFTLILFRRRTPLFLGPGQLAAARLLVKENAGVLLQRPVSGGEARARRRPGG